MPTYLITGDHGMEPRSLANFYTLAQANSLPLAAQVRGVRCLFLDMCGPGLLTLAVFPYQPPQRPGAGSDATSIGAWEENEIMGTQLGPNRNAKSAKPS